MWDVLIEADSRETGFQERWLGLLDAERYSEPPYDERETATSEDPNSDLVEGRAFLRVDVGSAAEAENLAYLAICEGFPDAKPSGAASESVRFTIAVFAAQGSFTDAVERISEPLEEW